MNILSLSRTLMLVGALLIVCAYLYLSELSFAFALGMTWVGISLIATTLFINTKKTKAASEHHKLIKPLKTTAHSREIEIL